MMSDDSLKNVSSRTVRERFEALARQWQAETAMLSSTTKRIMHPAYQAIIGLGPAVVPILIEELRERPNYWFWALKAITGEDPVCPEDRGNLERMARAWIEWAEARRATGKEAIAQTT
jgi:hypothetical protein